MTMQNFYTLHIDPVALGIPSALSCEIVLRRATVADSFVIVPQFKKRVTSLPADVPMLTNDPGSIYEVIFFDQARKNVAAMFFEMPDHNANLDDLDLLSAWPAPETNYALELVAATNIPDAGLEIGSYAPIRGFSIVQSDPHVVRMDSGGELVLRIDRLRDGVTATVGSLVTDDGVSTLSLVDGPAQFAVGDVLIMSIQSCPNDCTRVSVTLSVRFQKSAP